MVWFKVDDGFHDHRKVRAVDDPAAIGLWTLAGSWSGQQRTDGFVPEKVLRRWTSSWRRLAVKLDDAGLWAPVEQNGEPGYRFHDWSDWQPEAVQVEEAGERWKWRRKAALKRNRELCETIAKRDRDLCRYCGTRVNWADRRGAKGATYDHVDPAGENSLENVVVACRRCNSKKSNFKPEEVGMTLRPEPGQDQKEPGPSQAPNSATAENGTGPDRIGFGRAGSDRVGPGSGQVEPSPGSVSSFDPDDDRSPDA